MIALGLTLLALSACTSLNASDAEPLTLPDGSRYEGSMQDGLLHGNGKLSWANGDVYKGEFQEGLITGQGTLTLDNGEVYRGHFIQGVLQGQGEWHEPEGGVSYVGDFKDDLFHGDGVYTDEDGGVYTGEFERGNFTGLGTYTGPEEQSYAGEFVAWRYHGYGVWEDEKRRYTGEFSGGYFHGFGEMLDKDLGQISQAGEWEWGQFSGDSKSEAEKRALQLSVERALYSQAERMQKSLSAVEASQPGAVDVFALLVAGDGTQQVFHLESQTIADHLQSRWVKPAQTVTLSNYPDTLDRLPMATVDNLREALEHLSGKMQSEDILFAYLTSHGSAEHEFSLQSPGHDFVDITPQDLALALEPLKQNSKVLMVSACYSGGFIEALKAPNHLLMTAARDDRTSFGCGDSDTMTYFGRAYFEKALPESNGFIETFAKAKNHIENWEDEEEFDHSEPQIFVGETVKEVLNGVW